MKKKLIIKLSKVRKSTLDKKSRLIVVGYNTTKPNGGFIEKLGVYGSYNSDVYFNSRIKVICSINLKRLGYWLNKGALIKSKPS
jgi:ribosomal protein S16